MAAAFLISVWRWGLHFEASPPTLRGGDNSRLSHATARFNSSSATHSVVVYDVSPTHNPQSADRRGTARLRLRGVMDLRSFRVCLRLRARAGRQTLKPRAAIETACRSAALRDTCFRSNPDVGTPNSRPSISPSPPPTHTASPSPHFATSDV